MSRLDLSDDIMQAMEPETARYDNVALPDPGAVIQRGWDFGRLREPGLPPRLLDLDGNWARVVIPVSSVAEIEDGKKFTDAEGMTFQVKHHKVSAGCHICYCIEQATARTPSKR